MLAVILIQFSITLKSFLSTYHTEDTLLNLVLEASTWMMLASSSLVACTTVNWELLVIFIFYFFNRFWSLQEQIWPDYRCLALQVTCSLAVVKKSSQGLQEQFAFDKQEGEDKDVHLVLQFFQRRLSVRAKSTVQLFLAPLLLMSVFIFQTSVRLLFLVWKQKETTGLQFGHTRL